MGKVSRIIKEEIYAGHADSRHIPGDHFSRTKRAPIASHGFMLNLT
jgi:hypothetical protein